MSIPGRPPETYQQWMDCLRYLQEHPSDGTVCLLMQQGTLPAGASETFKARLSDTVSMMLSVHCRRFLRQVDQALSEGDGDMVPLLAKRFWRTVSNSLFYRRLAFLDGAFVALLEEGYTGQLRAFWKDFLRQLERDARESGNPELEDLVLEMKKIRTL